MPSAKARVLWSSRQVDHVAPCPASSLAARVASASRCELPRRQLPRRQLPRRCGNQLSALPAEAVSPAATVSLRPTYLAASSCFVALVFGILWPTSNSGMNKRPNLSAYKKGAALRAKKD